MGGFTGFLDKDGDALALMLKNISHRGPASSGTYMDEGVSMGVCGSGDGGGGCRPLLNEDETVVMVFDGTLYNGDELRDKLMSAGHSFSASLGEEAVIHAYEEYGCDFLPMLRGMFAFAIYDKPKKRLFCARDPFGIKPLYYYGGGPFMFGSEIKSFLPHPGFKKELNLEALPNYLTFQYSVLDETFFKGVVRLKPGHSMVCENGAVKTDRYFEPAFAPKGMDLNEAVESIDKTVCETVELYKNAGNAEAGAFLSSGVDSSYVAACMGGGKTFTVGFENDDYNEIPYAEALSKKIGAGNISARITSDEFWESLKTIQYQMDEPLADPSAVALYFASRLAARHVKVAMSGEGADEFFGGYNIYREPIDLKALTSLPGPIRKFLGRAASALPFDVKGKNFFIRGGKTVEERFIGNANIFSVRERERILKRKGGGADPSELTKPYYERCEGKDDITKMQTLDIQMWMAGDILLKADRMSAAHALEIRTPLLDMEVFKLASGMPVNLRTNKTDTKYAFRQAAKKRLPEEVAKKKKLGFPVPIRVWLREEKYYSIVKEYFTDETAAVFFHTDRLLEYLEEHKNGKRDNSRKIWTVLMFLIWYGQYF